MNRREFLRRGGLALAGSTALLATPARSARGGLAERSSKMKRIGCTTVCFRMRFPQTQPKDYSPTEPDLTLIEVPAFFADKLGVHNVELWSRHFQDTSLQYCGKIKAEAEKVGSRIINVQLDEPGYNLSHRDPSERKEGIELVKQWMDRAAACGATSLRANTGGSAKEKFDVAITGDSYRQLAEYGKRINVKILIENHGGHSSDPNNVVAIIKAVNPEALRQWCRTLPDFGNMPADFTLQQRNEYLEKLYPYAYLISAKGMYFDEQGKHLTYDIGACVRAAEASGFKGIYSAEQWSPKPIAIDALTATRSIIQEIVQNL